MRPAWVGILQTSSRGTLLRRPDFAAFIAERLPAPFDPIDELLAVADTRPAVGNVASTQAELETLGLDPVPE